VTNYRLHGRTKSWRAFAAWLGLFLLLWQPLLAADLPAQPIQLDANGVVICSEHDASPASVDGKQSGPIDHHSMPDCPCCLPFTAGNTGAILTDASELLLPASIRVRQEAPVSGDLAPSYSDSGPHQPRAPPVSI